MWSSLHVNSWPSKPLFYYNEAVEPSFRTLRKHIEACQTDLLNFDWNQSDIPAGISEFTECSERRLWRHTISSLNDKYVIHFDDISGDGIKRDQDMD